MLKTRIVTAIFLLAGLLGALFFLPDSGWIAFCALICAGAAWEWGGLAGWGKKRRIVYGAVLGGTCFVLVSIFFWNLKFSPHSSDADVFLSFSLFLPAVVFWLLIAPFWLWRKWRLRNWSAVLTGVIVLVPPTLGFMLLREGSPLSLLALCAIVWVADIAAYFSGQAFGGKKLAPNISPGKTWAGAFGAIIGVLLYGNALYFLFFYEDFKGEGALLATLFFQLIFIGLAAVSIVGDLFESLLKRQADVKDSSNLLPGHGGVLDRIDSLTSTLPCVCFLIDVIRLTIMHSLK
jgi:phosphatidate cytidylyltransferase